MPDLTTHTPEKELPAEEQWVNQLDQPNNLTCISRFKENAKN